MAWTSSALPAARAGASHSGPSSGPLSVRRRAPHACRTLWKPQSPAGECCLTSGVPYRGPVLRPTAVVLLEAVTQTSLDLPSGGRVAVVDFVLAVQGVADGQEQVGVQVALASQVEV